MTLFYFCQEVETKILFWAEREETSLVLLILWKIPFVFDFLVTVWLGIYLYALLLTEFISAHPSWCGERGSMERFSRPLSFSRSRNEFGSIVGVDIYCGRNGKSAACTDFTSLRTPGSETCSYIPLWSDFLSVMIIWNFGPTVVFSLRRLDTDLSDSFTRVPFCPRFWSVHCSLRRRVCRHLKALVNVCSYIIPQRILTLIKHSTKLLARTIMNSVLENHTRIIYFSALILLSFA